MIIMASNPVNNVKTKIIKENYINRGYSEFVKEEDYFTSFFLEKKVSVGKLSWIIESFDIKEIHSTGEISISDIKEEIFGTEEILREINRLKKPKTSVHELLNILLQKGIINENDIHNFELKYSLQVKISN